MSCVQMRKDNPECHNSPGGMCSIWDLVRETDEDCKGFKVLGTSLLGHCDLFGTTYSEEEGKEKLP